MYICSKCGKEKNHLFDVVSEDGIVGICEDCNDKFESPTVKKPIESVFKDENSKKSVYERLSFVAGVNLDNHKVFEERSSEKENQDEELKALVERNIGSSVRVTANLEEDLVRNFHWVIMRARRLKKLTFSELAREIKIAEDILKLIEKGELPNGQLDLIRKLELFFGIQVLTAQGRKKAEHVGRKIAFDPISTKVLTIDDLREMKKDREEEIWKEPVKEIEVSREELGCEINPLTKLKSSADTLPREDLVVEKSKEEEIKEKNYNNLSKEDINDIIFGRK